MSVDSYLEVFTTLFGWMFYGVVWDVLTQTGIVYLPFLGMVIDYWREPAAIAPIDQASEASLRVMEIELFTALLVVVLAAQPASLTAFRADAIQYTPTPSINNPTPTPVNLSTNDSTFGHAGFVDPEHEVETPAWWFAVLSLSSGLNHAVIEGLPNSSEVRQTMQLARMVTIDDPNLRAEVAQFYQDCYTPSRSKFLRERPNTVTVRQIIRNRGADDIDWMGSYLFRTVTGYYDRYRASIPVPRWPYDAVRDTEYDPSAPPASGRPFCKDWWEHPTRGLREALIASVNLKAAGYPAFLVHMGFVLNSDGHKDAVARTALLNRKPNWSNNDLLANNKATEGWLADIEGWIKSVVAGAGVTVAAGVTSITISVLLQLLPMLQALLLLCIYALLPMLMVLSRYSLGVMVSVGIAIFGIKFWTVLWYLAQWVDQNLIVSMYPESTLLVLNFILDQEHGTKRILLNTVTGVMYIGLPVLWTIIMGWAGIKAGSSINAAVSPYGRIAADAGQQGTRVVGKLL